MQRTIRLLQFEATLCLAAFCAHFGIRHECISEMVVHQLKLLRSDNLPEWNTTGTKLRLGGRGDPISDELARLIPRDLLEDFARLVDYSTEVGITDLFVRETDEPSRFLRHCHEILKRYGIVAPVGKSRTPIGVVPWGEPLGQSEFESLVSQHSALLKNYL